MKSPAAFRGTYADWKLVKTRGVIQVVFEVPLADSDAAYDVLGGMPNSSKERWFGIAPLRSPQEEAAESRQDQAPDSDGERRPWQTLQPSARAAIRCGEPMFWAFLREECKQPRVANKEDAATAVRKITGVNSRAHLNENHKALTQWNLLDSAFLAWQAKERVGA